MSELILTCRFCGRTWIAYGHRQGFLYQPYHEHEYTCKKLSPKQRQERNKRDEKRWKRNPPSATIYNNPNHPGLK